MAQINTCVKVLPLTAAGGRLNCLSLHVSPFAPQIEIFLEPTPRTASFIKRDAGYVLMPARIAGMEYTMPARSSDETSESRTVSYHSLKAHEGVLRGGVLPIEN